jgi:hypothetical protein
MANFLAHKRNYVQWEKKQVGMRRIMPQEQTITQCIAWAEK